MEHATTRRGRHGHPRGLCTTAAAVVLAAGAWGWTPHAEASDEATFKAAYEAAAAAQKSAVEVGFEWRDTKKMLRQASTLAKKGEFAKAVALANQARRQGELGVMQAEEQETVWRAMVVK